MNTTIRELRDSTGMTQKAFAAHLGIPVSTLRKWEQAESSPAPYVLQLIARSLPAGNASLEEIRWKNNVIYYYDAVRSTIADQYGNCIAVHEDLSSVKRQNLPLYLHDLFQTFYDALDKFQRDCYYDRKEDIIWSVED